MDPNIMWIRIKVCRLKNCEHIGGLGPTICGPFLFKNWKNFKNRLVGYRDMKDMVWISKECRDLYQTRSGWLRHFRSRRDCCRGLSLGLICEVNYHRSLVTCKTGNEALESPILKLSPFSKSTERLLRKGDLNSPQDRQITTIFGLTARK